MSFGGFAAGFAKTFDPKAVGGAINEVYASSGYDDAMEAAKKKYDEDSAALEAQRGQKKTDAQSLTQKGMSATGGVGDPTTGTAPVNEQAIPAQQPSSVMTQGATPPVGTAPAYGDTSAIPGQTPTTAPIGEDAAALRQAAPEKMSPLDYDEQRAKISMDKQLAELKAKQTYYKRKGLTDKAMDLDKEIEQKNWHMGMIGQYYGMMRGDPAAQEPVLKYMNATSMDGSQYVPDGSGGYNLVGANGKVLQQGVQFTPQQMQGAFRQYYAAAEFARSGEFDKYFDRTMKEENAALNRAKFGETRRQNDETKRHNEAMEKLYGDRNAAANRYYNAKINALQAKGTALPTGNYDIKSMTDAEGNSTHVMYDKKTGKVVANMVNLGGQVIPLGIGVSIDQLGAVAKAAKAAGKSLQFDDNFRPYFDGMGEKQAIQEQTGGGPANEKAIKTPEEPSARDAGRPEREHLNAAQRAALSRYAESVFRQNGAPEAPGFLGDVARRFAAERSKQAKKTADEE